MPSPPTGLTAGPLPSREHARRSASSLVVSLILGSRVYSSAFPKRLGPHSCATRCQSRHARQTHRRAVPCFALVLAYFLADPAPPAWHFSCIRTNSRRKGCEKGDAMLTKSAAIASNHTGRLYARKACFDWREFFPLTSFAIKMKDRKSASGSAPVRRAVAPGGSRASP